MDRDIIQSRLTIAVNNSPESLNGVKPQYCILGDKPIGSGGFAETYELVNTDWVVKVVCPYYKVGTNERLSESVAEQNEQYTESECIILTEARNNGSLYIVPLEGWCKYEDPSHKEEITFFEFMPKMLQMTAEDVFGKNYHKMSELLLIQLGIDICYAFQDCEKLYIKHRDVKRDNILSLLTDGEVFFALSDFNTAGDTRSSKESIVVSCTEDSPEVVVKAFNINKTKEMYRTTDERDFLRGFHYTKEMDWATLGNMLKNLSNKYLHGRISDGMKQIIGNLCEFKYSNIGDILNDFADYCSVELAYNIAKKEAKMGHVDMAIRIAKTGMRGGNTDSTRLYCYLNGWLKKNMAENNIADRGQRVQYIEDVRIEEILIDLYEDYQDEKAYVLLQIYRHNYANLQSYADNGNPLAQLYFGRYLIERDYEHEKDRALEYLRKASAAEDAFLFARKMLRHYLKKEMFKNKKELARLNTPELDRYREHMKKRKELKRQREMRGFGEDMYKERIYTELFREYENDILKFV